MQYQPEGNELMASWYSWAAMTSCRRLFWHLDRLAASRADWTAGMIRATRTPMMAITTRSSISVKADRRPEQWRVERIGVPSDRGAVGRWGGSPPQHLSLDYDIHSILASVPSCFLRGGVGVGAR